MRLQRYLNEKYYNTIVLNKSTPALSGQFEVFVNPSKKELKEVTDEDGYRFTIDFRTQKVYVQGALSFHEDLFNSTPDLPKHKHYWYGDFRLHTQIFTGNFARGTMIDSDVLGRYKKQEIIDLLEQDWSWVKRFLPADKIIDMLEKRIKDFA
jgi:hypothetical protein